MSSENNRLLLGVPEPSSILDTSMDFPLNYSLYAGGFQQPPATRAVDSETLSDSVPSSGNLLECPSELDDSWRNVAYSGSFETSKRHSSSNSDFIQESAVKRPRLDGTSFSESETLLFKSSLESTFPSGLEHKSELLGGISESFDFASTPDPPDDNSNLAQSISLIQETLDQSIAQADDRPSAQPSCQSRQQQQQQQQQHNQSLHRQQQQQPQQQNRHNEHLTNHRSQEKVVESSADEIPMGKIQAQSTPLESLLCNGKSSTVPRVLPVSGSSSYDSLLLSAGDKNVSLKEYRLVFVEQVFERNNQIIRRQMVQREHTLERTLQLSQKEYDRMMQCMLSPTLSQTSENFADVSELHTNSQNVVQRNETKKSTNFESRSLNVTERLLDSEPAASKNVENIFEFQDIDFNTTESSTKKVSTGANSKSSSNFGDVTAERTNEESSDPKVEFKEPKSGNEKASSSNNTSVTTAVSESIPESNETISSRTAETPSQESNESVQPANSRLTIGSSCLAQWSDQLYYMATVSKVSRTGRYGVKFADGTQETVKEDLLFPLKAELECGQPIYVKVRNVFEYATIKNKTTVSQRPGYVAELHTKRVVKVTKDKIVFTQEMVDVLKEKQMGIYVNQEGLAAKGIIATTEANTLHRVRKGRSQAATLDIASSDGVVDEGGLIGTRSNLGSRRTFKTDTSVVASESGGGVSGSSLNPPTLVFEGMGFLLTDTERAGKTTKAATSGSSFESTDSQGDSVEFNKEQLQNLIEENGGVVFKSFTEAECANSLDTGIAERYLLSRSHMKTLKYVLCLAAGIRCLSHQIVYVALREGRMPEPAKYQLPAGISLTQRVPVEQPSRHTLIFKNMTIAVVAEKNEFVNTWSQVLIAAGGRIASKLPQRQSPQQRAALNSEGTGGAIRYMVTTPECPGLTLRSARALRIAPVSSEWVVQSIIHAKVLAPDSHDAFAYDYKKTE